MKRILLVLFYFVSALVGVVLLDGLALTSHTTQDRAAKSDEGPNDAVTQLKKYIIPYTYMDEEFHVPQAANYFVLGNFTAWDPMITTPFGAYVAAYLLRPLYAARQHATRISYYHQDDDFFSGKTGKSPFTAKLAGWFWKTMGEWSWTPSEIATLSRATNCVVATASLYVLISAFSDSVMDAVNEKYQTTGNNNNDGNNSKEVKKKNDRKGAAAAASPVASSSSATMKRGGNDNSNSNNSNAQAAQRDWVLTQCRRVIVPAVLQICFYPTLFFFTALYYTEPSSVFCLSCCFYVYQISPRDRTVSWLLIALLGVASVLVRQTNLVWVAFLAGSHLVDLLVGYPMAAATSAVEWTTSVTARIVAIIKSLFRQLPVILLGVGFVAWAVVFNDGSIVLGDKTSHKPVIHLAQIPLMFCFLSLFSPFQTLLAVYETASWLLLGGEGNSSQTQQQQQPSGDGGNSSSNSNDKKKSSSSSWLARSLVLLLLTVAGGAFAQWGRAMQFHPYLIADNRHYTNLLYRYVLKKELFRIALCAGGGICGLLFVLRDTMRAVRSSVDTRIIIRSLAHDLVFLALCAVTVVPQKLLEPRYFLAPAMFQILRSTSARVEALLMNEAERRSKSAFGVLEVETAVDDSARAQAFDVAVNIVVHVATMYVFVFRPFVAPNGSVGRFMW